MGFDCNQIRDCIRDIGLGLGFDAQTEKPIGEGVKVDVVWRIQIPRLGVTKYVFIIHFKGPIDSLIMDLQKTKSDPGVQKIIVVSDRKQLELLGKVVPAELKGSISLWDIEDVKRTHEHLAEALKGIKKLGLPLVDILVLSRFPLRSS